MLDGVAEKRHLLETLEGAHGGHRVALHQDVAAGEQLQSLQRRAVGPQQPLPPLHKLLLQCTNRAVVSDPACYKSIFKRCRTFIFKLTKLL